MKTVEEVRRERLKMLKEAFGTWSALNERLNLPARDSTLSQYANQYKGTKTGATKVMGSPMARRLEVACGKEPGWMDTDPDLLRGENPHSEQAQQLAEAFDALPEPDQQSFLKICGPFLEAALHPEEQLTAEDEAQLRRLSAILGRRNRLVPKRDA